MTLLQEKFQKCGMHICKHEHIKTMNWLVVVCHSSFVSVVKHILTANNIENDSSKDIAHCARKTYVNVDLELCVSEN
jgi:hypothetical protein